MSLSKNANGAFGRYSTGPLYSPRELRTTENFLRGDGFFKSEDNTVLGMRIFTRADGANAVIYLDELNCNPLNSGTMFVTQPEKPAYAGTVWDYAKLRQIEATKNPVLRFLKKNNPFG